MLDIDPDGPAFKLMTSWGPPVITLLVGGVLANLLYPRWQERAARNRTFNERRFAIMEEIADLFPPYVAAWRRLVQISELERTRPLSDAESERKMLFVSQRTEARDALCSALSRSQIYFSDKSWDTICSFLEWDEANSAKRLEELPEISEWRYWQDEIIRQLKLLERR